MAAEVIELADWREARRYELEARNWEPRTRAALLELAERYRTRARGGDLDSQPALLALQMMDV